MDTFTEPVNHSGNFVDLKTSAHNTREPLIVFGQG